MPRTTTFSIHFRNEMLEYRSESISLQAMFWRWLCLFAFRRWKTEFRGNPVGVPGERDPRFPCQSYMPRPRATHDMPHCRFPDGHYLCWTCTANAQLTNPGTLIALKGASPTELKSRTQAVPSTHEAL